jgi:hypothetical protein
VTLILIEHDMDVALLVPGFVTMMMMDATRKPDELSGPRLGKAHPWRARRHL